MKKEIGFKLLNFLLTQTGKNYIPDRDIPLSLVLIECAQRILMLIRGLSRLQAKVFLGRKVKLRGKRYLKLGEFSTIDDGASIDSFSRNGVEIGSRSKIGAHTIILCTSHFSILGEGLVIGDDSGIGEYSFVGCSGGIKIGNSVIAGQYVSFHSQEHLYSNTKVPIRSQGVTQQGILIEDDVWIGAKATILDGTSIGHHSIIAAGSVVKGVFPPNSIIGGIPGRVLRSI